MQVEMVIEKQVKNKYSRSLDGFNLSDCSTEAEGASRARTELPTRNRISRALPPTITPTTTTAAAATTMFRPPNLIVFQKVKNDETQYKPTQFKPRMRDK
ncbi:hypothetical protein ACFX13_002706 [Malus domestica]